MSRRPSITTPTPLVLSGPILRRSLAQEINLWLVTSVPVAPECWLYEDGHGQQLLDHTATAGETLQTTCHQASPRCYIYNLSVSFPNGLPQNQWLYYDLKLCVREPSHADYGRTVSITEWAGPDITYGENALPGFVIQRQLKRVLHGSCRKPHHPGEDGLARADRFCDALFNTSTNADTDTDQDVEAAAAPEPVLLTSTASQNELNDAQSTDTPAADTQTSQPQPTQAPAADADHATNATATVNPEDFPGLLVFSGDQIYADDVGGPMLWALHQLIHWLDFPTEPLVTRPDAPSQTATLAGTDADIENSEQLYGDPTLLYARNQLLPDTREGTSAYDTLFGGARKPVFTSVNANNHLITLAEMISMYLLIWSPACWPYLSLTRPEGLSDKDAKRYAAEEAALNEFIDGLSAARRVMAHIPVAMIFDDHDVTDDWNLTAAWERAAYAHPLSKRIIGNSLIAYLLCQSWGNAPEQFSNLSEATASTLLQPGTPEHDQLIDTLIHYPLWGYHWNTTPLLKVLDTRTQRWRSERSPRQPSGLLDWESLCHLQQSLIDEPSVLLVAPAPVFGVKLIEGIQKVMTWLGQPLMVDAENWMAHSGTANTLLHMFCHAKTPPHFVILSGDVHYSFAYQVRIRGEKSSPTIWQITSSGLRNTFPATLLAILDRLNRWLYSPRSPLNWFTKRRRMQVTPYKPSPRASGQRLANRAGIGLVVLDATGKPTEIHQLCGKDAAITFDPAETERV